LAYLLLFSFIAWVNATTYPVLAQEQNPDAQSQNQNFQEVKADTFKSENPESNTQVVEKTESAKPKIKKRYFPWLGVILSLAIAGGLIYYFVAMKPTLKVDSTPTGAKVYLDGNDTAKVTPCELKPSIGTHKIKVSLDGYVDLEREVVIKNGKNSLNIQLVIGMYTLTKPASNAIVQREAPCLISWDSTAMAAWAASPTFNQTMGVPTVDLELYRNDAKVSDITRGVPNSGSYTWNVPATTSEGYNFKIKISCPGVTESGGVGPPFDLLGFKEDFADNAADFWLPDNATSWNTAGGYLSGSKTTEWAGGTIYDFIYSETSYTVESRMRWSEFSGSSTSAPLFIMLGTWKSFTGNSGYLIGYTMDGKVSIYALANFSLVEPPVEPPTPLYSASCAAVNTGVGNWNTLKVVRNGSTYTIYINDTMVYAFVDSTYNPRCLVLGFIGSGAKTSCDFDYVYMTVNH
jgi:hypothetical protein